MKRLVPMSVVLLTVLLLIVAPFAASAQATPMATIYVVQPGDTLTVITNRYCMTQQELYNLNGAILSGQLSSGMQLRVINHCGGTDGGYQGGGYQNGGYPNGGYQQGCVGNNCCGSGVFDRGPRIHALGWVYGNTYFVMLGDTSFSIGQRFGVSADAIGWANGINPWRIWAGQRLIIPGLGGNPCPLPPQQPCPPLYPGYVCPPVYPTVIPITPVPTQVPIQPRIQIDRPAPGATLPPTFTVSGSGQGLFEGSLIVEARSTNGTVLAQQPVTLQGTNVGAGGPGTFSVQMTVNVPQPTAGFIVAYALQTPTAPPVSVAVTFSSGGSGGITYTQYQGNQCRVTTIVGMPYFGYVGGPQTNTFGAVATYSAIMGAKQNNQLWFLIGPIPATNTVVWAPATSVSNPTQGCQW